MRILVTRDEEPHGPLSSLLTEAGAHPVLRPSLEVVPLLDVPARAALREELASMDWLILTSPRATAFLEDAGWFDAPPPRRVRVAVAGEKTGETLTGHGWPAHLVPERAGGEPLLDAFLALGEPPGRRVLFPASAQAGEALPRGLEAAGYLVRTVPLYAPRPREQDREWWEATLDAGLAALTFTSPSAVEGLVQGVAEPHLDRLRTLPAAVQGPTTGAAALEAGWCRVEEARPRSFQGLVAALERLLQDPVPSPEPDAGMTT